jgi:hypothetical protein
MENTHVKNMIICFDYFNIFSISISNGLKRKKKEFKSAGKKRYTTPCRNGRIISFSAKECVNSGTKTLIRKIRPLKKIAKIRKYSKDFNSIINPFKN